MGEQQDHGQAGDRRWWNGRWGRLARVDVVLRRQARRWIVEHRIGGVEGQMTVTEFDGYEAALGRVRELLAGADDWRELPLPGGPPS